MRFHNVVEAAIDAAPIVGSLGESLKQDWLLKLGPQPDDFPVEIDGEFDYEHMVCTNGVNRAELAEIFQAICEVGDNPPLDPRFISGSTRYLDQVWRAAEPLGAVNACFSVFFHRPTSPSVHGSKFFCTPSLGIRRMKTTKLGLALLTVHPVELSDHNRDTIRNIGYVGVNDVGYRAMAINHRNEGVKLPIPLSFPSSFRGGDSIFSYGKGPER